MEYTPVDNYENGLTEYNKIKNYDTRMLPITYIKNNTIHKLIHKNMGSLVPNVEYGKYKNMLRCEMDDWINNVEEYIKNVSGYFLEMCESERKKLIQYQREEEKTDELNMDNIVALPDVLKKKIFKYMTVEDQIMYYTKKYCNICVDFESLKVAFIRKLYTNIFYNRLERCIVSQNMYIMKVYDERYQQRKFHNKNSLLSRYDGSNFPKNASSKKHYIYSIKTMINECANVPPLNKTIQTIFVNEALRMIKTLIYFVYYSEFGLNKKNKKKERKICKGVNKK